MNDEPLTGQHKKMAAAIWEEILAAPCAQSLELVHQKLEHLPREVRLAISMAIVQAWQRAHLAEVEDNVAACRTFRATDSPNPFR
ncbi:hypothetical protein EON80_18065 [bacterium]|nr:MAG: hypothetical protein EON80_18065 [bacterium]